MSKYIGLGLIGLLVLLSIVEVIRYGQAACTPDALPYPRRRLSRRLAVTVLFCTAIGLGTFWPGGTPFVQLAFILVTLLCLMCGLLLLWRDLRETSEAALRHTARLSDDASNAFIQLLVPPSPAPPGARPTRTEPGAQPPPPTEG